MDPRLKTLAFLPPEERQDVRDATIEAALKLAEGVGAATVNDNQEHPATEQADLPEAKRVRLLDIFEDEVEEETQDIKDVIVAELGRYIAELKPESSTDILQWWKERAVLYPNLARVARYYLAIPASSTPAERVFSTCGNLVTKKRACIDEEMVDMVVFLNKNLKKL